ncbi:MAG TPA: DUF2561 family protein [Mycobacterium sp.]|nr:DUF2561 family protein [Mycobacterium sp.]
MTYDTDSTGRSRLTPALDLNELDRTDRILLGSCAAIWLVALGAGVAATVALIDLGGGHAEPSAGSGTPWLLYTVIGVSAVVIIGAVPLLLRARRAASAEASEPAPRAPHGSAAGRAHPGLSASGQRSGLDPRPSYAAPRALRTLDAPEPALAAVDRVWVRCALVIACATGIAMVTIAVATYLMAVDSDVAAWVFYVLTAVVTLAMPAVPWFYLKELRAQLNQPTA